MNKYGSYRPIDDIIDKFSVNYENKVVLIRGKIGKEKENYYVLADGPTKAKILNSQEIKKELKIGEDAIFYGRIKTLQTGNNILEYGIEVYSLLYYNES